MSRGPNMGGMKPTTITFYQLKNSQILRKWQEHEQNMSNIKDSMFQLLAHPDATDEQIAAIRETAKDLQAKHIDMVNLLRAKGYDVE